MIAYIWGNLTVDNFTPRPDKDTVGRPGQEPGLSASEVLPAGRKAQGIDLNKLTHPLKPIPDDVSRGGTPGHIAIAPVDEAGNVDLKSLREWASYRKTGRVHPFTQILFDAVVETNVVRKA